MNNYLLTIILVSIGIGILDIISPNNSKISKYTQSIGLLVILCVIISPISKIVKTIDEGFINNLKNNILIDTDEINEEYQNILNNYLSESSISALENQIDEILNDKFDIPSNESEVKVITQYIDKTLHLSEIKIALSGMSIFKNPYTIEEYFYNLLESKCTVTIK